MVLLNLVFSHGNTQFNFRFSSFSSTVSICRVFQRPLESGSFNNSQRLFKNKNIILNMNPPSQVNFNLWGGRPCRVILAEKFN